MLFRKDGGQRDVASEDMKATTDQLFQFLNQSRRSDNPPYFRRSCFSKFVCAAGGRGDRCGWFSSFFGLQEVNHRGRRLHFWLAVNGGWRS